MRQSLQHLVLALACSLASHSAPAQPQRPDALAITQTDSSYVLQVPVARLQMFLPSTGLRSDPPNVGGATSNPRYYNFSDSSRGLVISGWFEPANRFPGLAAFWEGEQAAWKRNGLPEPRSVSLKTIGIWQTIFYDLDLPGVTNRHVRAHAVQAGTWIDLHISLTGSGPQTPNREDLISVLEKIVVSEKP